MPGMQRWAGAWAGVHKMEVLRPDVSSPPLLQEARSAGSSPWPCPPAGALSKALRRDSVAAGMAAVMVGPWPMSLVH